MLCAVRVAQLDRHGIRDPAVGSLRPVQIDHRRPLTVVTHPRHEVLDRGPRHLRGQVVAGVPQVVEVQPRHPDRCGRLLPADQTVERAAPQRATLRPGEYERVVRRPDELGEMRDQHRKQRLRETGS
ncbi:MAG TPA: hypothetical protein VI357_19670 [Mycobacteriales bacterium]